MHKQLLQEVAVMHQRLHGVPPLTAELQFILDAQELDGYGREYYPVKVTSYTVKKVKCVILHWSVGGVLISLRPWARRW